MIDTLADARLIDKVRADGVGGLAISISLVNQTADLNSKVILNGATLRNLNGDLIVGTKGDANVIAGANTFSAAAINGANATSYSTLTTNNHIILNDATLIGRDIKLLAGQDSDRALASVFGRSQADMTLISLFGVGVPLADMVINENNWININGTSQIRAIGDIDLVAEEGLGDDERATQDGLIISLGGIPYGTVAIGKEEVNSSTQVNISTAAFLEAGINYKMQVQVLPYLINGVQQLPKDRVDTDLTDAEKTAIGLDPAQQYEYAALTMDTVAMSVSSGDIIEVVAGAVETGEGVVGGYYQFNPESADGITSETIILDQEDYLDTTRWTPLTPDHVLTGSETGVAVSNDEIVQDTTGLLYRRTGVAITIDASAVNFSDDGRQDHLNRYQDLAASDLHCARWFI